MKRIAVATDHAGFFLKASIIQLLQNAGCEVMDLGTNSPEPVDYPDYAMLVADAVRKSNCDEGILLCGSGAGAAVVANKFPGIRAAVCHDTYSAHQSREHDDCNVLCLGSRVVGAELAFDIIRTWLSASFTGTERYRRRVNKIRAIERQFLK
jgi:ribose 5-phosphate isomerase B